MMSRALGGTFQQLEGVNAAMQHKGDGRAEVFGSFRVFYSYPQRLEMAEATLQS